MIVALQICGALTGIVGVWFVGNKKPIGPALAFISGLFYLAIYVTQGLWIFLGVCVLLMAIDARNFIKWTRKPKEPPCWPYGWHDGE